MARISGVDLPQNKKLDIALTRIYGIGRSNVQGILKKAKLDSTRKVNELTEQEVNTLQKTIEGSVKIEGDLRQEIQENLKRLKQIGSYRGMRHIRGLPVRGQRTRSNARTKRGKRQTIGAMRKEMRAKMVQTGAKK